MNNPSFWMLLVPTICYLGVGIHQAWWAKDLSEATIWFGYTLANLGFLYKFWYQRFVV